MESPAAMNYSMKEPGGNISITTTEQEMTDHSVSDQIKLTYEVCKWANGFIILLGLVTNTLIIVVLSRSKIGSVTTKIILLFLAATDITVVVVDLFLHYIPFYWRWFPIFYEGTCGLAVVTQSMVVTAASWYITLMTIERFIVVWLPMKARLICTKVTMTVICSCIPIVCFAVYAYHIPNWTTFDSHGYTMCKPKTGQHKDAFRSIMQFWVIVYFFIPAAIIVALNTAIVAKLRSARTLQRRLTQKKSYHQVSNGRTDSSANYGSGQMNSSKKGGKPRMSKRSSVTAIRKATVLVIIASVTFVVLMIPRGVSSMLVMTITWSYESESLQIFDYVAYQFQYLNHATNFFLYVLANASFRKELVKIFRRKRASSHQSHQSRTTSHFTLDADMSSTKAMNTLQLHQQNSNSDNSNSSV